MKSVIPVGLLLVALVVLATLQYQWIGQITLIERQKLRSSLVTTSNRFVQDFKDERDRLYGQLQGYRYSEDVSNLIVRYREWVDAALHKNLVQTLYVADSDTSGGDGLRLRQVFIDEKKAEPILWPSDLGNLEMYLERELEPPSRNRQPSRYRPSPGDAMVLVVAVMGPPQFSEGRGDPRRPEGRGGDRPPDGRGGGDRLGSRRPGPEISPPAPSRRGWVIARLDRSVITDDILPFLTEKHFHNEGQSYRLAVVDTDDNLNQVYTSSGPWTQTELENPDYALDLFSYSGFQSASGWQGNQSAGRPPERGGGRGPGSGGGGGGRGGGRGLGGPGGGGPGGPGGGGPGGPGGGGPGGPGGSPGGSVGRGGPGGPIGSGGGLSSPLGQHWRLLVTNEAGSLDAAVEQLRRRNLGVAFGVLLVLSAAALVLVFSGQRARALGKLQMEFAAGVSHELRTPLTVIQSAAHNLRSGVVRDPRNVEQYAEIVQKEARRLSGMVEQVMAYAETQSGRRRYDITAVDVTDIVDQALKSLVFVDDAEVKVERRIQSDLPPALADPVALSQCLQNLISNAVKYGQRDGVVELDIEAVADPTINRIRISVMDRGAGVPPKDVPHLFEAFHRGSNVSTSTPGNGIGLHLVRKTIESQHGSVTYSDRPGGGSVFTLNIPAATESRA
jgi:signal transduction histidine kinase